MFQVGQLAVCIKAGWRELNYEQRPHEGSVYTVRAVVGPVGPSKFLGLRFEEIVNRPRLYIEGHLECAWNAENFRPVRTHPIDIFREIADDVTKTRERIEALAGLGR